MIFHKTWTQQPLNVKFNFIFFSSIAKFFRHSKFIFKNKMEQKSDNPFGPVCQCSDCLKCIEERHYCFCCNQLPNECHSKPKFKLYFKSGIPCLMCKKLNCPHKFLESKPCEKSSDCSISCIRKWINEKSSHQRGHKNVRIRNWKNSTLQYLFFFLFHFGRREILNTHIKCCMKPFLEIT